MIAPRCCLFLLLCGFGWAARAQPVHPAALSTPRESLDRISGFSIPLPETVGALDLEESYLMTRVINDQEAGPNDQYRFHPVVVEVSEAATDPSGSEDAAPRSAKLKALEAELQRLQKTHGPRHPVVQKLRDQARSLMQQNARSVDQEDIRQALVKQLRSMQETLGPDHPKVRMMQRKIEAMAGRKKEAAGAASDGKRQPKKDAFLPEQAQRDFGIRPEDRALIERMRAQLAEQFEQHRAAIERLKREAAEKQRQAEQRADQARRRAEEAMRHVHETRERAEHREREEHERREHEERERREHHGRERAEHREREEHERREHEERERREHHERERAEHREREEHERREHEERERREHHERERAEHREREEHERREHEEHREREMAMERVHVLHESAERMAELGMEELADQLRAHAEEIEHQWRGEQERHHDQLIDEVFRRLDHLQEAVMELHRKMDHLAETVGHGHDHGPRRDAGRPPRRR